MRHFLRPSNLLLVVMMVLLSSTSIIFAETGKDIIRAIIVKDKATLDKLIKETKKIAPFDSDIEVNQIVKISHNNNFIYIVPARVHGEVNQGCYIFSFDQNIQLKQKITLSKLEELESCEIIKAVFSCNRENKTTSGVGVLYGKRLGADHYWFEGSYLAMDPYGMLSNDEKLSERLTDIDTVFMAKKKLECR